MSLRLAGRSSLNVCAAPYWVLRNAKTLAATCDRQCGVWLIGHHQPVSYDLSGSILYAGAHSCRLWKDESGKKYDCTLGNVRLFSTGFSGTPFLLGCAGLDDPEIHIGIMGVVLLGHSVNCCSGCGFVFEEFV